MKIPIKVEGTAKEEYITLGLYEKINPIYLLYIELIRWDTT